MSQNTRPGNIGFGWIYYGLVRNLDPDFVVAIGSCAGFAPFCAARALQDNGRGKVLFIDPSYSGDGHPGWSGRNYWSNPAAVAARVAAFGLTGWFEHLKMTSEEAFPIVCDRVGDGKVGLIIVDGAHTYADSLRDFELYSGLVREGYVLFHDATSPDCEVARTLAELRSRGYALITLDIEVGLAVVEVRRPAMVRETWSYLCAESNRGELLLPFAQRLLRPGDRVLDIYCGFSPLTPLLSDVAIFGYDHDGAIVQELAARHPQHVWRQTADRQLQLAELPPEVDVVLGLGVSRMPYGIRRRCSNRCDICSVATFRALACSRPPPTITTATSSTTSRPPSLGSATAARRASFTLTWRAFRDARSSSARDRSARRPWLKHGLVR